MEPTEQAPVEEQTELKVYAATVYLKSGASFTFDTTKLKTQRHSSTNELVGLTWNTPADTADRSYRQIHYIRLDDVSAIALE